MDPEPVVELPPVDILDRRSGPAFMAYKWGVALIVGVLGFILYQVEGRADLGRSTTMLDTALDRALPFWTWTSWLYEPFYVAIFIIGVIGFQSRFLYNRAIIGICANVVVAALGHFFIRAEYPRPVLPVPYPDLSTWFLARVHEIDPPGNVFPSLHVAHSFLISFIAFLDRPRLGRVMLAMSIVLAISTLTTKQHFIADVVAGLVMAFIGRAWVLSQVARAISASGAGSAPRR
jgi:membrane-associated phospholipid phosphatase